MFNSKIKPVLYLIYAAMIAALLSACGNSTPSDTNVKSEIEKGYHPSDGRISPGRRDRILIGMKDGTIKVDSFTKVNGQASEFGGIKMYSAEYQAVVVFLKDRPRDSWCIGLESDCGGHKVGDKKTIQGSVLFELTEKGWMGPSGAIY